MKPALENLQVIHHRRRGIIMTLNIYLLKHFTLTLPPPKIDFKAAYGVKTTINKTTYNTLKKAQTTI